MATKTAAAILTACLLWMVSAAASAQTDPRLEPKLDTFLVHFPRGGPASGIAEALQAVFPNDREVRIVADGQSNTVLIRVSEGMKEKVTSLLQVIDRAPSTVTVHVWFLQSQTEIPRWSGGSIEQFERFLQEQSRGGNIDVVHRLRITALENTVASIQEGRDAAVVTGRVASSRGIANSRQMVSVGTMLTAQSLVRDGRALLELQWERSDLSPTLGDDSDEGVPSAEVTRYSVRSTLEINNNSVVTVQDLQTIGEDGGESILAVGAQIHLPGQSHQFAGPTEQPAPSTRNRPSERPQVGDLSEDAYERYARGLIRRYDDDEDGRLNADEIADMRTVPQDADVDGDGQLNLEEVVAWLRSR